MTKQLTFSDFEQLAESRNHLVIDFSDYREVRSSISFYCKTCGEEWITSGASYKNAKGSCPGCKRIKTSQVHTGKNVREETRKLIGKKASQRQGSLTGRFGINHPKYKGGYGRDLIEPSTEDYIWKNAVRKRYNYKCALTNKTDRCCCHHLNGWNSFPNQRFDVNNGVYICYQVHKEFHDIYKYGNNTEDQWAEFVSKVYKLDWYKLKKSFDH